ncbi:MAG: hypothetical protein Q8R69_08940, partial [Telluria sp.]|nr:hypothetical protein [Telluria sp.]
SHDIRGVLAYLFCAASHAGMGGQLLDALDKAGILLAGDPGITKDVTHGVSHVLVAARSALSPFYGRSATCSWPPPRRKTASVRG